MKAYIFVLFAGVLTFTSCKKEFRQQQEETVQIKPHCGTVFTSENLSGLQRQQMRQSSSTVVAPALLLYLNFDGTFLTKGSPNSTGTSSTIINQNCVCPAAPLTSVQKEEIVRLVSDDFSPFMIQV